MQIAGLLESKLDTRENICYHLYGAVMNGLNIPINCQLGSGFEEGSAKGAPLRTTTL